MESGEDRFSLGTAAVGGSRVANEGDKRVRLINLEVKVAGFFFVCVGRRSRWNFFSPLVILLWNGPKNAYPHLEPRPRVGEKLIEI